MSRIGSILLVKPLKQKYAYNCGPTTLLMLLRYHFNVRLTQRDMNLLTSVTQNGMPEYNFFMALDLLGVTYEHSSTATIDKLKTCLTNNCPPIVHVILQNGVGHYMVVVGIDDEHIKLIDTRNGKIVKWGLSFFLGVWKEETLNSSSSWYLIVTGKTSNKIDKIISKYRNIKRKLKGT